jgi:hypothetical protein
MATLLSYLSSTKKAAAGGVQPPDWTGCDKHGPELLANTNLASDKLILIELLLR